MLDAVNILDVVDTECDMLFQRKTTAEQISELRASRREIVRAFEIERRRIERDLHDGAQQYIVAANMALGEAQLILQMCLEKTEKVLADSGTVPDSSGDSVNAVDAVNAQLHELSRILFRAQDAGEEGLRSLRAAVNNIHPHVLSNVGLEVAVRAAAESSPAAAQVVAPHPLPLMPDGVAAAAYFFVCEALTNVAKYAPSARATILLAADKTLHVSVVDDGPGGAKISPGHGLAGLRERLAAFGGDLRCDSPQGGPTTVAASIPLLLEPGESGIVR
ncbi:sensor histidine kinase [Arcanobacterium hippocoleae]|uniref:histidine kinase n=3 Tax=Arcanobacterium hippocoleae TaxID=149017 RepID=A0ABU1T293_9ACTO|nr:signal transduction histidine kinase [Arcanobacterium hippocoleae]